MSKKALANCSPSLRVLSIWHNVSQVVLPAWTRWQPYNLEVVGIGQEVADRLVGRPLLERRLLWGGGSAIGAVRDCCSIAAHDAGISRWKW